MITIIALIIGLFFAMNIGISGAAASMGITYGTGVIKKAKGRVNPNQNKVPYEKKLWKQEKC